MPLGGDGRAGLEGPGGGEVGPVPQRDHAQLGEVQLAPVVAVDQEEVGGLEVLDDARPLAAGQGVPRVLAVAAEVQGEHGVVEALEVLGQPLALELQHRVLEVLARPARLVDQHDHRRGRAELRAIVRGGQRGAVEGMEPEVEVVCAGRQWAGGPLAQRVARIGLGLLLRQRRAALVADLAPRLPAGRCCGLRHHQADQGQQGRQRPARLRRQCPVSLPHRDVPPTQLRPPAGARPGARISLPTPFIVNSNRTTDKRETSRERRLGPDDHSREAGKTGNMARPSRPLRGKVP